MIILCLLTSLEYLHRNTAQKMKFSIKDFFSKCGQIRMRIWSHLLKKSLMENFFFCAVNYPLMICSNGLKKIK